MNLTRPVVLLLAIAALSCTRGSVPDMVAIAPAHSEQASEINLMENAVTANAAKPSADRISTLTINQASFFFSKKAEPMTRRDEKKQCRKLAKGKQHNASSWLGSLFH